VYRLRLADFERAAPIALPSVRLLMLVGLALVSALVIRQVAAGLAGEERGLRQATEALVTGPLAPLFWVRIVGGLVIPAVLLILPLGRRPGVVFTSSVLALAGILLDRFLFVATGQVAPVTAASGTVSHPYAAYSPTVVEIAIIVGAGAFMAFFYTLAERYLDMGEGDEHIFFAWPWIRKHGHDEDVHEPDENEHPVEAGVAASMPAGARGAES